LLNNYDFKFWIIADSFANFTPFDSSRETESYLSSRASASERGDLWGMISSPIRKKGFVKTPSLPAISLHSSPKQPPTMGESFLFKQKIS
jgi:hypothetical protein